MCDTTSFLHEKVGQSVTGRAYSSCFDPIVKLGFVQSSRTVALNLQMRGIDSERLSSTLGDETERILLFLKAKIALEIHEADSRER